MCTVYPQVLLPESHGLKHRPTRFIILMVCLYCPTPRPRPRQRPRLMQLGSMIMVGGVYSKSRLRLMQISVGSVRILSVSVSVLPTVGQCK